MRDLQKDLELLEKGLYPSGFEVIQIAKHALEIAIKAEALNRELVEALELLKKKVSLLPEDCREPDKVVAVAYSMKLTIDQGLVKAKEVLE